MIAICVGAYNSQLGIFVVNSTLNYKSTYCSYQTSNNLRACTLNHKFHICPL